MADVGEIGSRVGRNQTTVMRTSDRWMQGGTTDRRGRSHSPQCTTSLTARTIRHRLQQSGLSARRPLLGLPLTQNYRRLRHQWCDKKKECGWQNGMKLSLLTSHASVCNTTMVRFESGDTVEREAEQLRYAPSRWSCTGYYGMDRYWISLSHSSSTHCRYFKQLALHLRGVGTICSSLPSGFGHSHISTGQCTTTRGTYCPKVLRQSTD
ncbi:transposable element Tcb1 transposase [Trichonephila clavipes]|nr:transposable element Tcb1 transposase [Trichonephila clavipes]